MQRSWSTACPDWKERLLRGDSLVPDLPLFADEAAYALRVFKRLRIPDMHGKPTMGEVAGPWLFPIVEVLFGSYDVETNVRMIQEYFWLIPKKNTKTSSGAAIMQTALIINRRPEAEFVLIGPTKETADISFRQMKGIIRADPELTKLFHVQDHVRKITHRLTGATCQVKAADTDVITGGKQVGTLVDEIHVLAAKPNAADILIELRGALTARPDGFFMIITTQSKKPPVGIFKTELAKARAVRDGKLEAPLLPILYELPIELSKDDGWKKREYWHCVNPNLKRSVSLDFLSRELTSKETEGNDALALFASQHFNVEIGLAFSADGWPGAAYWLIRADAGLTLKGLIARCDVIVAGIDGGGLDDLLGLTFIGREIETGRYLSWSHAWAHEGIKTLRKQIASKLEDLEKAGDLTFVSLMKDAHKECAEMIKSVETAGLLGPCGLDPAGASGVVDALSDLGIEGDDRIIGVRQGYSLAGPAKDVETKLSDGDFIHADQPLMDWCVGNAKVEKTKNAEIVTKAASGSAKIDPFMALLNGAELMRHDPQPMGSVYSGERGLYSFG